MKLKSMSTRRITNHAQEILGIFLMLLISCDGTPADTPGVITSNDSISGRVVSSGQGIAGVVVTNGFNLTVTDDNGCYSLPYVRAATHIYISSPSGYSVPVVNSVPQFYLKISNITDRDNADFEITALPVSDQKHYFIAVGDPQVRNEDELQKLKPILEYMKSDIEANSMNPVHLMVTGDIVFNTPLVHDLSKSYFSAVEQPVYNSIGNHDHLQNTSQAASDYYDAYADSVYIRHYGPTYYSFNRGEVHYIVLDNIFFRGGPSTDYYTNVTDRQLNWLQQDLSYVPQNKALVLVMHAPTKSRYKASYGNSDELHALLSGYADVHIVSGHTHYNSMLCDDTGITEHIVGAACGGWWEGPVCTDGTSLGYKIFEADGTNITWKYRAYQYPDKVFSVFKPGERDAILPPAEELLVNVWDWDSCWSVEWSEDDGALFTPMTRYSDRVYDPVALEYYGEDNDTAFPPGRTWVEASPTDHIFTCVPSEGTSKVIIRVTDHFGQEHTEEVEL